MHGHSIDIQPTISLALALRALSTFTKGQNHVCVFNLSLLTKPLRATVRSVRSEGNNLVRRIALGRGFFPAAA